MNFGLYVLTCQTIHIEALVNQINSRKYIVKVVKELPSGQWFFAYEGTELLRVVRNEVEPVIEHEAMAM